MSLVEEGNGIPATMLVGPTNVGGAYPQGNSGGFGWGGDMGWLILFLLLAGNGGWGNGFGGGYGGMGAFAADGAALYPWMNQTQQMNNGFRDQMINQNISDIEDTVNNLTTQLCNSTAGIQQAISTGLANAETAANARQMANMQQSFANQTAMNQGFNALQGQLSQCCCENRLATCQTQNIVQNEGNATRFADANNTRDIIDSQTRGTQAILDKLCQLELDNYKNQIDSKNDQIAQLRSQLQYANMQASQVEQTAQLRASDALTANQLVQELRSCPIPSQPVYGNQPIFTCPQNATGCGCSGNSFFN